MSPRIYYFKGDAKHDPGWYWPEKTFDNGPYFCYGDAAQDAGTGLRPDPLDDNDGIMMRRVPIHDTPKLLTLAKIEYVTRSRLLGASLALILGMFWYSIYKLTLSVY